MLLLYAHLEKEERHFWLQREATYTTVVREEKERGGGICETIKRALSCPPKKGDFHPKYKKREKMRDHSENWEKNVGKFCFKKLSHEGERGDIFQG